MEITKFIEIKEVEHVYIWLSKSINWWSVFIYSSLFYSEWEALKWMDESRKENDIKILKIKNPFKNM
jgi:hypothetical protein